MGKVNKSVKLNYIYNLTFYMFSLIAPIVTAPYISRVLGSNGIGQYSYSFSIVSIFTLFASFGFSTYAQREIARFQNDKYNQSKTFYEIMIDKAIISALVLALYTTLVFMNVFGIEYREILLILSKNYRY